MIDIEQILYQALVGLVGVEQTFELEEMKKIVNNTDFSDNEDKQLTLNAIDALLEYNSVYE